MTPEQCRNSRTALGLGVREFAEIADVSPSVVASFERGGRVHKRTVRHLSGVLEAARGWECLAGSGEFEQSPSPMSKLIASLWALSDRLWFKSDEAKYLTAYRALLDTLSQFLDIVAQEEREPDAWERRALNGALNALCRGSLALAFVEIRNAITPLDNRSPHYPTSVEGYLEVADLDMRYFRRCVLALVAYTPRRTC